MALIDENGNINYLEAISLLSSLHCQTAQVLLRSRFIESTNIPTLQISKESFNIIINPNFVKEHCTRSEHLALLICHELFHILFGQVCFLDREDGIEEQKIKGIALDTIINVFLYYFFNKEERFVDFLTNFYEEDIFPQNLLRPDSNPSKMPLSIARFYQDLYTSLEGCSADLYEKLKNSFSSIDNPIILIGNHTGEEKDKKIEDSVIGQYMSGFIDEVEKVVEKLTPENEEWEDDKETQLEKIAGFRNLLKKFIKNFRKNIKNKEEIENAMRKLGTPNASSKLAGLINKSVLGETSRSVIFSPYDKRSISAMLLKIPRPFHKKKNLPKQSEMTKCTIYIDVSGSVNDYIPVFMGVVKACEDKIGDIYLFSNKVEKIEKSDFISGKYKTTGGTDDCWLEHIIENKIKKALIFTDGYFDFTEKNISRLTKDVELIFALVGVGTFHSFFDPIKKNIKGFVDIKDKVMRR